MTESMVGPKSNQPEAPLRSYGRRKARPLSVRKQHLLDERLPRLRLPLGAPAPAPLARLFERPVTGVWLEIGFGSGEHLAWQAGHHPAIGFIGCEPFINGVSSLLGTIEAAGINSIRLHDGDARAALAWLPAASIGRAFILFPDPWPKKKHLKRRLLGPNTAEELARVIEPGGELRFASDNQAYAGEALRVLLATRAFLWTANSAKDWRLRPADWPETRYERKALSAGRKPAYLSFRRV